MNISVLGIDIAKNIFQLHGVDSSGKRILKQRIEREQLSIVHHYNGVLWRSK